LSSELGILLYPLENRDFSNDEMKYLLMINVVLKFVGKDDRKSFLDFIEGFKKIREKNSDKYSFRLSFPIRYEKQEKLLQEIIDDHKEMIKLEDFGKLFTKGNIIPGIEEGITE